MTISEIQLTQSGLPGAEGGRRINSLVVIEALADAMCMQCISEHIRCDNGPEMIAKA